MKEQIIKIISKIKAYLKNRWLFYSTIIVFSILTLTPLVEKLAFVPDYFNLSQVSPKNYFRLIIGAIASIFGILMAVVLLTVEIFRERLNNNELTNPLENVLIRNSIYNSVNLIGLSFLAYVFFNDFNTSKGLTIGYFLGGIFIAYIYSVYPVLKKIIGKTSQIKSNIDIVNTLNQNSFKIASRYSGHNSEESNEILKTLKKELDSYILNNNVSAYEKISNDILNKALYLMSDGQNRNECDVIISGLVWLWRENCKTAIRVDDAHYFELVWNYIKDIYVYFANNKAPLLHLQDLHFFIIYDLFKLHIKFNSSTPFSTALNCIEISFKSNLFNNSPKQEDLKDLIAHYEDGEYESIDFHSSSQWSHLKEILDYLVKIQETAVSLDDRDIFEESTRRIESICYELNFDINMIGYYQKGSITWQILTSSFANSYDALKSGMYENTLDCFEVPKKLLDRLIEESNLDVKDIRIIIRTLADNIILAFKEKKLFMNKRHGTLKDFCLIGIYSMKHYNSNKMAKQTVKYIIKVLKHLKELAEEDLKSISPNDYLAIKSRVKHFADEAVRFDDFSEDEKPVKKWRKICNDFKDVTEEVDFGIVKWKVE